MVFLTRSLILPLLALALLLVGCSTPDSIRKLEAESVESIKAYHANAERAVSGLIAAFRSQALDALDTQVRFSLLEEELMAEPVQVIVTPATEDTPATLEERRYLSRETLLQAMDLYREKISSIEENVEGFKTAWTEAQGDFTDALEMRRQIKDYLSRSGVEPEDIEALAEALAREIERSR